jgi:hypothetical protein
VRPPTRVLYICGSQRGGTSLLGWHLGSIDGFLYAGEVHGLWTRGLPGGRVCGCGKPREECEVWSKVLDRDRRFHGQTWAEIASLQREAIPDRRLSLSTLRLLRRGPVSGSPGERYGELLGHLYASLAEAAGAQVVVDASKLPAGAAFLRSVPGVSLYVMELVRDPRGVMFSRHKRDRRRGVSRSHPLSTARASGAWVGRHLASRAVRRRCGAERSLLVRYEDYVGRPIEVLERVAGLLEVEGDLPPPAPAGRAVFRTGHPSRGAGRFRGRELALRLDQEWVAGLHTADVALTTMITLPLLLRYGYPMRSELLPGELGPPAEDRPTRRPDI